MVKMENVFQMFGVLLLPVLFGFSRGIDLNQRAKIDWLLRNFLWRILIVKKDKNDWQEGWSKHFCLIGDNREKLFCSFSNISNIKETIILLIWNMKECFRFMDSKSSSEFKNYISAFWQFESCNFISSSPVE